MSIATTAAAATAAAIAAATRPKTSRKSAADGRWINDIAGLTDTNGYPTHVCYRRKPVFWACRWRKKCWIATARPSSCRPESATSVNRFGG